MGYEKEFAFSEVIYLEIINLLEGSVDRTTVERSIPPSLKMQRPWARPLKAWRKEAKVCNGPCLADT